MASGNALIMGPCLEWSNRGQCSGKLELLFADGTKCFKMVMELKKKKKRVEVSINR